MKVFTAADYFLIDVLVYSDALGAAVGWAACIQGNEYVRNILNEWRIRSNSFSLAVCNGCQLTALLGWQEEYDKNTFCKYL